MATIGQAAERIRKEGQEAAKRAGVTALPASRNSGEAWTRASAAQTAVPEKKQTVEDRAAARTALARNGAPSSVAGMAAGTTRTRDAAPREKTGRLETVAGQEQAQRVQSIRRELDELNRLALDPAVHQNPMRINQVNQRMKELRASIGEQTLGDRVESGIGAAAASIGASYSNLAGLAAKTVHSADQNRRNIAAMQRAWETGRLSDGKPVTPGIRRNLEESIARMEAEIRRWEAPDSFQNRAYRAADRAAESSARLTAEAKEGLGKAGQFVVDVGVAGAQMGGDALIAALTGGSSLAPMAVRAAGGAAQEARQAGANLDQQWAYGLGSAALSVGTEKISNIAGPFRKMFGTGAAEKIAGNLVKRFGENGAVQLMQKLSKTAGGRIALSAIGEGGEEVVESVLQPFLQRATYDPDARFDPREAAHGFAVGAVLGGLGGVPEAVGNIKTGTARDQAEAGLRAQETGGAGVDAAPAENTVQRLQSGENGALETRSRPEPGKQGGLSAGGGTVDVMEREVRRLYGKNKAAPSEAAGKPRISMEDFANTESSVWNNVEYGDTETQSAIMRKVDKEMVDAGEVVQIPEDTLKQTAEYYPDMRGVKKSERVKTLKEKITLLKGDLRKFLNGLKGSGFEFEVNGNILEAKLYSAGIREVLEKINQDKASMLLHSDAVFRNAKYLYSTPDYDGDPNIYRWNYFYTPVRIGDQTLGVRIAVRDMKQTAHKEAESQIYNWGIKKDVLLGGGGPGVEPLSSGASSSTSSGDTSAPSADSTITGDSDFVKSGTAGQTGPQEDPLLTAIFGGKKRVDQSTLSQEQFEHLAELSGRGEVGMDAAGRVYQVNPEEHIDRRDIDTVGSRKLNAFQFDHPELHGYFAEAAQQLGLELSHYVPGGETASRVSEDGQPYSYRLTRTATPRIAQLIDTYGIPPRELSSALEAIINDRGQENYAAAKRLELMLDLMLSDGYTDPITGAVHGPNEAYLAEKRRIAGSGSYDGTGLGAADAGSVNTDYDRLQAQSDSFHPEGPNAARPVDVPTTDFDGRPISQTASTVMGAMAIPDDVIPMIEQMTADGKLSYDPVTNAASEARARKKIEQNGFDGAVEEYRSAVLSGRTSPEIEILGQTLLNNAANARDGKAVAELLSLYQAGGTNLGQAMQARQIMRKLSPEGQLYAIQRSVYNIDGEKIQVSPELIQKFLDQTDQAGRDAVMEEICRDVAGQLPGSWGKIFDSIRYLAMLGNTRTHIRNIIGNAVFQPFTWGKNRLGGIAEAVAQRAGVDVERTKTWHGANPLDHLSRQARAEYKDLADLLNGGTHYNEDRTGTKAIREYYNPFKNVKRFQKLADALDWSLGRLSRGNMGLLEKEDNLFKTFIYGQTLADYLQANGVESIDAASPELLSKARNYAAQEALRNTFNDSNMISDAVASLGKLRHNDNPLVKGVGYAVEGTLPFKRTPANVAVRAVEYSPAGPVVQAAYDLIDTVVNGNTLNLTAGEVSRRIDRVAASLSGSALGFLGFLLARGGLVTGGDDEDEDQRSFDSLTGHQSYAIETKDGTSYTLDWAAPAAIPFFMGVELYNMAADGRLSRDDWWRALKNLGSPMLNMSMLQGLNDTFEEAAYAQRHGDSVLAALMTRSATGYFTQAFPTAGGQLERVGEDRRMTTYTDKNKSLSTDTQYTLGKISQKVPGWDYSQIPYIDAWGREEETGDVLSRILQNTISPGYASTVNVDAVERELQRVKDATGDGSVFPERAGKYFDVDGKRKDLTAEEYLTYAKALGQESCSLVKEGISLPGYRDMSDTEKAEYIKKLYAYANQSAKAGISDYAPEPWVENARNAERDLKVSPAQYIALYAKYGASLLSGTGYEKTRAAADAGLTVEEYAAFRDGLDADGNGAVSQEEARSALDRSGFSRGQKADLWEIINKSWKKNPYASR